MRKSTSTETMSMSSVAPDEIATTSSRDDAATDAQVNREKAGNEARFFPFPPLVAEWQAPRQWMTAPWSHTRRTARSKLCSGPFEALSLAVDRVAFRVLLSDRYHLPLQLLVERLGTHIAVLGHTHLFEDAIALRHHENLLHHRDDEGIPLLPDLWRGIDLLIDRDPVHLDAVGPDIDRRFVRHHLDVLVDQEPAAVDLVHVSDRLLGRQAK